MIFFSRRLGDKQCLSFLYSSLNDLSSVALFFFIASMTSAAMTSLLFPQKMQRNCCTIFLLRGHTNHAYITRNSRLHSQNSNMTVATCLLFVALIISCDCKTMLPFVTLYIIILVSEGHTISFFSCLLPFNCLLTRVNLVLFAKIVLLRCIFRIAFRMCTNVFFNC